MLDLSQVIGHRFYFLPVAVVKAVSQRGSHANSHVIRGASPDPYEDFSNSRISNLSYQLAHSVGCGMHGIQMIFHQRQSGTGGHLNHRCIAIQDSILAEHFLSAGTCNLFSHPLSSELLKIGADQSLSPVCHGDTGNLRLRNILVNNL